MKLFIKITFILNILFIFSSSLFGQELTSQQKEVLKKIAAQNKSEEAKRKEIEDSLGLYKPKEIKDEIFWKDGIGLTTKTITKERDMSQYEDGGNFDCRGSFNKDEFSHNCDMKKVRDFIWKCWVEKRNGYIRVTYNGIDAGGTSHYFIEQGKNVKWQIMERTVRYGIGGRSIGKPSYIAFVERIESTAEKGEWTLLLKDKSNEIVWKIPDLK